MQMKETKTAKGGTDCPTLLHYLARILMRTDPLLVTFIEDLPNLEPAARGIVPSLTTGILFIYTFVVSVQTIIQSVNSLVTGLGQVKAEITELQRHKNLSVNDQFISVMQVIINFDLCPPMAKCLLAALCRTSQLKHWCAEEHVSFTGGRTALLAGLLRRRPRLARGSETRGSIRTHCIVLVFSPGQRPHCITHSSVSQASLQKCGLELHDGQDRLEKAKPTTPKIAEPIAEDSHELVSGMTLLCLLMLCSCTTCF